MRESRPESRGPSATGRDLLAALLRRLNDATRAAAESSGRASDAAERAAGLQRRSQLLRGFVEGARRREHLPLRCAWCGRVDVGGEFVAPAEFLSGDLPERLRERATHSICPDCLEREQGRADAVQRARREGR